MPVGPTPRMVGSWKPPAVPNGPSTWPGQPMRVPPRDFGHGPPAHPRGLPGLSRLVEPCPEHRSPPAGATIANSDVPGGIVAPARAPGNRHPPPGRPCQLLPHWLLPDPRSTRRLFRMAAPPQAAPPGEPARSQSLPCLSPPNPGLTPYVCSGERDHRGGPSDSSPAIAWPVRPAFPCGKLAAGVPTARQRLVRRQAGTG